ncbi:MAG: arginine--tRNA ligase [Nanoarchaeota archaeon]|nr:arginine--tRNA ligase [Nanoarchaeota archaeon]
MFKQELSLLLSKNISLKKEEIFRLIEIPLPDFGDYSFPCFILAKKLKKDPKKIAEDLQKQIKPTKEFERIQAVNGYLNFSVNRKIFAEKVLNQIFKEKDKYGYAKDKNKKVVIESPGPNTNKPLHLGHLRNMALGISLSNILKAAGYKVVNVDIVNNRGIHIVKSTLAYKKYGNNKKPNKKSDHFVGDFYVLYAKKEKEHPELQEELKEMLRKYEAKDPKTLALIKKLNDWALKGIYETYKKYGMHIDKTYYESEHYEKGKKLVQEYLKKGLFEKKKDGSISINLEEQGLGEKVLLRSDGTCLYITQDLYLAIKRYQDFKPDKMIYIVGSEQIYHFKVLFTLLKKMKYKFADNYIHFPYGMVYLPEGKMKSREGTVVDVDNLLHNIKEMAKKEILTRDKKINKKELEARAEKIAFAAINFYILKFDALKDFTYKPEESLSFEGETGPYIQYAYARASSILRNAKQKPKYSNKIIKIQEQQEHLLVKELSQFPELVQNAAEKLKPDLIANYTYKLAQTFTSFYTNLKVLTQNKEEREERLLLTEAAKQVLANSLELLNIKTLEKM